MGEQLTSKTADEIYASFLNQKFKWKMGDNIVEKPIAELTPVEIWYNSLWNGWQSDVTDTTQAIKLGAMRSPQGVVVESGWYYSYTNHYATNHIFPVDSIFYTLDSYLKYLELDDIRTNNINYVFTLEEDNILKLWDTMLSPDSPTGPMMIFSNRFTRSDGGHFRQSKWADFGLLQWQQEGNTLLPILDNSLD